MAKISRQGVNHRNDSLSRCESRDLSPMECKFLTHKPMLQQRPHSGFLQPNCRHYDIFNPSHRPPTDVAAVPPFGGFAVPSEFVRRWFVWSYLVWICWHWTRLHWRGNVNKIWSNHSTATSIVEEKSAPFGLLWMYLHNCHVATKL